MEIKTIHFPTFSDSRGDLTFIENNELIPFEIERIFYLYNVPEKEERGNHAHFKCHQIIIPLVGSLEVELYDGKFTKTVLLNSPKIGLHILPNIWAIEKKFSPGTVCLVLCSDLYEEADYIRDFNFFKKLKNNDT